MASKNDTITRKQIIRTKEADADALDRIRAALERAVEDELGGMSSMTQLRVERMRTDLRLLAEVKRDMADEERKRL